MPPIVKRPGSGGLLRGAGYGAAVGLGVIIGCYVWMPVVKELSKQEEARREGDRKEA